MRTLVSSKDDKAPPFSLNLDSGKKRGNGKNGGNSNGDQKPIDSCDINGQVFDMSPYYSGHADKETILDFLFMLEKKEREKHAYKKDVVVFLNHGDNNARRALCQAILARTGEKRMDDSRKIHRVETPHKNSPFFDLNKGEWEESEIDAAIRGLLIEIDNTFRRLLKSRSNAKGKVNRRSDAERPRRKSDKIGRRNGSFSAAQSGA